MLFLDWADPPMLVAKTFRYLSTDPNDKCQFWADRFFELFAVGFVVTRNIMFTYVAWRGMVDFSNDGVNLLIKGFLIVLVLLMKFWLWLIIRAAMHQVMNDGNVDDIRSDSDSDNQDIKDKTRPIARKRKIP